MSFFDKVEYCKTATLLKSATIIVTLSWTSRQVVDQFFHKLPSIKSPGMETEKKFSETAKKFVL